MQLVGASLTKRLAGFKARVHRLGREPIANCLPKRFVTLLSCLLWLSSMLCKNRQIVRMAQAVRTHRQGKPLIANLPATNPCLVFVFDSASNIPVAIFLVRIGQGQAIGLCTNRTQQSFAGISNSEFVDTMGFVTPGAVSSPVGYRALNNAR